LGQIFGTEPNVNDAASNASGGLDRCRIERPARKKVVPGHVSACHLNDR
jgi:hypothetical protein